MQVWSDSGDVALLFPPGGVAIAPLSAFAGAGAAAELCAIEGRSMAPQLAAASEAVGRKRSHRRAFYETHTQARLQRS